GAGRSWRCLAKGQQGADGRYGARRSFPAEDMTSRISGHAGPRGVLTREANPENMERKAALPTPRFPSGRDSVMEHKNRLPWSVGFVSLAGLLAVALVVARSGRAEKPPTDPKGDYAAVVQPLVRKYCLGCHSTKVKKGSLDLERFASL